MTLAQGCKVIKLGGGGWGLVGGIAGGPSEILLSQYREMRWGLAT